MYSHPLDGLENEDALVFRKTIQKQLERIEGRLYQTEKELSKNMEYKEHNKVYRRKNHLEHFGAWLRDCLQDLDDIHKGVPWKYPLKVGMMNREQNPRWYEWKDPKDRVLPPPPKMEIPKKKSTEDLVDNEERPVRGIWKASKGEALLALGYDPNLVAALGL
nr:hypothetical protein [Marseillevirus cajuinensis]